MFRHVVVKTTQPKTFDVFSLGHAGLTGQLFGAGYIFLFG